MRAALAVDRWQGWIGGLALAVLVQGCVTTGTTTNVASGQGSGSIEQAQAEAYDGPKARIAVARFTDKTGKGWYTRSIGDGMADMLTTSLVNTNRYIVLERQALGAVLDEQDLAASGRVREGTGAPTGQIEGAELLVVGAVTGLEGNSSGAKASGGGLLGGVLGGISGGFKKSYMAVDMRVIDTRTSRVVAATTVEGEATDVDLSGFGAGFGGGALGGSLSVWKDTPMEKALRIVIDRATQFVVSKTPRTYYHYGAGGRPPGGGGGGR
nr:hypothetical protein [Gemmatimonadota bacterium]NIU77258.1 hypothetical protein [Gammaproteobacteria bacterium]